MARLALVKDNSQKALTQLAQIKRPQSHPSLVPWTHMQKAWPCRRAAYRDGQRAFQFAIRSGNECSSLAGEAGRMAIAFRKFKDARAHFQAQLFENPLAQAVMRHFGASVGLPIVRDNMTRHGSVLITYSMNPLWPQSSIALLGRTIGDAPGLRS